MFSLFVTTMWSLHSIVGFCLVRVCGLPALLPFLISGSLLFSQTSYACPKIGGLVDFNCDEKHHIVGLGDSFVGGRGDLERPTNPGYISRLKLAFPDSKTFKIGIGGISSQRLLAFVKQAFEKTPKGPIVKTLGAADILIIDVAPLRLGTHLSLVAYVFSSEVS